RFVPAAQYQWAGAGSQHLGHLPAQRRLRLLQRIALADDVARIPKHVEIMRRQAGHHRTDGTRPLARSRAAPVAPHAGIAGKPQQDGIANAKTAIFLPYQLEQPACVALFGGIIPALPNTLCRTHTPALYILLEHRLQKTAGASLAGVRENDLGPVGLYDPP